MSAARRPTVAEVLRRQGVSRRGFLKFCAAAASLMALPPGMAPTIARALEQTRRPSVIWLSFQECTGCAESLLRSDSPTLESLIFSAISLDYQHTLQACAGHAAEHIREEIIANHPGEYLVVVDGSIPTRDGGVYSTIAGRTNIQILQETVAQAAAVIAVGTCAAYGGIPKADPNPTGAVPVTELVRDKPVVNVPGCPPIPVVITGVLVHYLTFGALPELDAQGRPVAFYGETIHDRCYRRPFYDQGKFARSFDDAGARNGWCLYELGCKGPTTHNACATTKWNQGASFPIQSGHGCLGCSEPDFWDAGSFYTPLSAAAADVGAWAGAALGAGAVIGAAGAVYGRQRRAQAARDREQITVDDIKDRED